MPRLQYKYKIGSFAPPLEPAQLEEYKQIAHSAPQRVREYMLDLIKMLEVFWETGRSKQKPISTESGVEVTPLEQAEIKRIWDYVPYLDECNVIGQVFNNLPPGTKTVIDTSTPKGRRQEIVDEQAFKLKSAAIHLLWYARELSLDREPVTKDGLPEDFDQ